MTIAEALILGNLTMVAFNLSHLGGGRLLPRGWRYGAIWVSVLVVWVGIAVLIKNP
jgi:hypothetical protein